MSELNLRVSLIDVPLGHVPTGPPGHARDDSTQCAGMTPLSVQRRREQETKLGSPKCYRKCEKGPLSQCLQD